METCRTYLKIKCPHCGSEKQEEPQDVPWVDEDTTEMKCYRCRENFILRAVSDVYWTTHKDEDDD